VSIENLYGDIEIGDYLKSKHSGIVVKLLKKDTGTFHGAFTGIVIDDANSQDWSIGEEFHAFRIEMFDKIENRQ
jgi:hypothetical protein